MRALALVALLVAGCGGAPVKPATPLTNEERSLQNMTAEQRSLYEGGKEIIRTRMLEFPNVPVDWGVAVYMPPKDGEGIIDVGGTKWSHVQTVGGSVTAGDNAGKRVARQWAVVFAVPELGGKGKLIPVTWQLGERQETYLSIGNQ